MHRDTQIEDTASQPEHDDEREHLLQVLYKTVVECRQRMQHAYTRKGLHHYRLLERTGRTKINSFLN